MMVTFAAPTEPTIRKSGVHAIEAKTAELQIVVAERPTGVVIHVTPVAGVRADIDVGPVGPDGAYTVTVVAEVPS